ARQGGGGRAREGPRLRMNAGLAGKPAPAVGVWRRPELALIGSGIALRLVMLVLGTARRVSGDTEGYLPLARRFSFGHPWAASFREPLWIGSVKAVAAPF